MKASDFCFSALATFFGYLCAQNLWSPTSTHVTKESNALGNHALHFHANCCVIYQCTIAQTADASLEDENLIKFLS